MGVCGKPVQLLLRIENSIQLKVMNLDRAFIKHIKLTNLAWALSALLLASCATHYTVPKTGPVATLRMTTNVGDMNSSFAIYEVDKGCYSKIAYFGPQYQARDDTAAEGLSVIGESTQPPKQTKLRSVQAVGRVDFIASASYGGLVTNGAYCMPEFSFEPQPGAQYDVAYEWYGRSCQVKVTRLTGALNGQVTREAERSFAPFARKANGCGADRRLL